MNIHITKEEHDYLQTITSLSTVIGSKLYGTNTESSDTDILCWYEWDDEFSSKWNHLPNYHQFQYKDIENNIDYIYCTRHQFFRNQQIGDSTINSDLIIYGNVFPHEEYIDYCYTFKVIRGYLGFAKRDIKRWDKGKNKLVHIVRGLYTAECLLNKVIPTKESLLEKIEEVKSTFIINNFVYFMDMKQYFYDWEDRLRKNTIDLYNTNVLPLYYIPLIDENTVENKLMNQLLNSNNIKEFKY